MRLLRPSVDNEDPVNKAQAGIHASTQNEKHPAQYQHNLTVDTLSLTFFVLYIMKISFVLQEEVLAVRSCGRRLADLTFEMYSRYYMDDL